MWVETAEWAVDHGVADVGWVQADLARTYALLQAQKLLNWRMTAAVADDTLAQPTRRRSRCSGPNRRVEIYRRLLGVVGAAGYLSPGSPGAALHGELERAGRQAQINTFGGGVNEVQREILATAGLGHEAGVPVSATGTVAEAGPPTEAAARSTSTCSPSSGQSSGPSLKGADPVNLPMIRHWVEAMGDHNPVYVDDDAARSAGFDGIIAPPTMLQAWIMRGLRASLEARRGPGRRGAEGDSPTDRLMAALDQAGFTSVVATNCDQHYVRPLVPGDQLEVRSVIDSVSSEKKTGLGDGHFITTRLEYTDQDGELVATMSFRILKFKPAQPRAPTTEATAPTAGATEPGVPARPKRPRPALTQDNRFFFDGAKQHKLLDPAVHQLRQAPPSTPAGLRQLPVVRMGSA